jgi:xylulokinase
VSKYLIGIDIGTAGTKAGLFDTEGNLLAEAYEESTLRYGPGWVEQDAMDFYRTACHTIRQILSSGSIDPKGIAGVAVVGQMAGILGIDEDWQPVTHYDSWLDTRCQPHVDWIRDNYGKQYIETVGMPPTIAHAPKMLWWMKERPEVFERIRKFVVPSVYVAGALAGLKAEDAFIDYTHIHFTGVANARRMEWSREFLDAFQLPEDKMPQIVAPWKVVGYVTAEAAEDTGLPQGTPVAAGAGDHAACSLGAGLVEKGLVMDLAGTASILSCCVERYVPDVETETLIMPRAIQQNLWLPHAYIGGGGLCLRWFRDNFAGQEKLAAKEKGEDVYDLLSEMAAEAPPASNGLLFVPHLGGRIYPNNSNIRGAWFGFSWNHDKKAFYRSILESIAYEYCYYMRVEQRLYPELEFKEVRAIGGGARSDFWNQLKANILGVPYAKVEREEVGIFGAALVAGRAAGIYQDITKPAKELNRVIKRYEVDEDLNRFYRPYTELYTELIDDLTGSYDKLAALNLERQGKG